MTEAKVKKPINIGIILFSIFTAMFYADHAWAQQINAEILCDDTIAMWKRDPSLKKFLASYSCSCPDKHASPVCTNQAGGASSRSSSAGSSKSSRNNNQFEKEIAATFMQSLLSGIMSNKSSGKKSAPGQPESIPNPKYLDAVNKIAAMRLPSDKARFLLDEALRSQREGSRLYNPDSTALAQLGTSYCLSQQAQLAAASYDRVEEASWLIQQSDGAMNGSLVEAYPGTCAPPVISPASLSVKAGVEPTEPLRALISKFTDSKEAHHAALKKNETAQAEVSRWKDTKTQLEAEAAAARTEEERKEKDDALLEAQRMLDAAEQNQEVSQKTVVSTEEALHGAEDAIQIGTGSSEKRGY